MKTCTTCGAEKAESHFRKFGRGRRQTCLACEGREQGEAVQAAQEAPKPVTPNGRHLEVAAGFGFRASIEDGVLHIEQDKPDGDQVYTHELHLAPHEARQFVEWIEAQVAPPR